MNLKTLSTNSLGIFSSLAIFCAVIILLNLPTKIIPASILGALTFSLFKLLTATEKDFFVISLDTRIAELIQKIRNNGSFIFLVVYILSQLLIILINPVSTIYVDWWNIEFTNWLRLVGAFLSITFLPGYAILSMANKTRGISRIAKILFSFLLSLFITSLTAFLLIVILHVSFSYFLPSFVVVNFILIIVFSYMSFFTERKEHESNATIVVLSKIKLSTISFYGNLSLFLCFALLLSGVYIVFFSQTSALRGDMWSHMQRAMLFYKDSLNYPPQNFQLGGDVVSLMDVPYWFHLYLASFFSVSGLPPMNSYIFLAFLNGLFMFPPYLVSTAFFKDRKKPAVLSTIIFSLSGGFGFVYVLFLKTQVAYPIDTVSWINILGTAVQKTAEDVYTNLSFFFLPLKTRTIGLISLFALVYLMIEKRFSNASKAFLITITTAVGYLFHVSEILIFVITFLPCGLLFSKKISVQTSRLTCLSITMGLLLVFLLDVVTSSMFYITGGFLIVVIILSLGNLIIALIPSKDLFNNFICIATRLAKVVTILLCYASGLAILVLIIKWPTFFMYLTNYSGIYPWYFYPFRFGITFIFMLVALIFLLFKGKHNDYDFSFVISTIVVLFLFGKIVSYINIYVPPTIIQTGYYERRILELIFLPVSILGGFAVTKIASRIVHGIHGIETKKFLLISVLTFILVISSFSSLLSVENFALTSHPWAKSTVSSIPDYELEGLNFIKDNVSPNSYVLTYSLHSKTTLGLAGVRVPYTATSELNQFFFSSEPATFFVSLFNLQSIAPTDYIYLNSRDLQSIPSSGFFKKHLAQYLPIAFKNEETVIYKLPDFTPPTSSNLTIVYPSGQIVSDALFFPLYILALGSHTYDIHLLDDPNMFNNLNILLAKDVNTFELVNASQSNFWTTFRSGNKGNVDLLKISDANRSEGYGTESLKLVIPSGNSTITGVFHNFDSPQDFSNYLFLSLSIYGQNTMQYLYLYFLGPSMNDEFQFRITEDWNGWKTFSIPLNNAKIVGSPDWAKVERLIVFKDEPGTLYLGQIMLDDGFQNHLVYENWVENGGNLIVFNSQVYGDFAKKLSINSNGRALTDGFLAQNGNSIQMPSSIEINTSSSKDENVSILANYTLNGEPVGPFAYVKKFGRGNIIYVEVSSLFSEIERMSDQQTKSHLFLNLGSFIDLLNLQLPTHLNDASIYPINFWREANFSGDIEIETSTFLLQQFENAKLRLMNFTDSKNPVLSGYPETTSTLTNVSLSNIEIRGSSTSVIQTTYVQKQTSPLGMGRYVPLAFEKDLNWTIISSDNTTIDLWVKKENASIKLTTHGGIITLSFDNNITYSALAKTPLFTVTGNAFLERAYFDWPYWGVPIKRFISPTSPSMLTGTFAFKIGYADSKYFFIRDFTLVGSGKVVGLSQFSEWDIPWIDVLTSPYHLLLVGFIIIVILYVLENTYGVKNKDKIRKNSNINSRNFS